MKLIYRPFGIIAGIIAGIFSKKLFNVIWARFDDAEPPRATTRDAPLPKVMAAAALQGIVFKGTRAAVDRYGARGFEYVTGTWPGDKKQQKAGFGN